MIQLYYAPRTRAAWVRWLLEELGLEHELLRVEFTAPTDTFQQPTRERAWAALDFVEQGLGAQPYLLGATLSGADVMMGFTLAVAKVLGVLSERHPALVAYMDRLEARPAFQRATAD